MTSKLKCPFCQKGLSQGYNYDRDTVVYRCDNCYFQGDGIIWQALIQAKQDLEIARKALEEIKNNALNKNRYHIIADANHALEQIEHKE